MIDLDKLMTTTPESLAKLQHDTLKAHFLDVLKSIQDAIQHEEYNEEDLPLFNSPAGDGWGLDNVCIDFSYAGHSDPIDIQEALTMLRKLRAIAKGVDKSPMT